MPILDVVLTGNDRGETGILAEIEPRVAQLIDRHLGMAKEWFPHEYIPWSLGRDFDTEPWTPDQPRLDGVAQTAFHVNLLTEDNLPSYHSLIGRTFKGDGAWRTWIDRWTAEEGRHAIVIRDYLMVTRNVDPVALERGRMRTMSKGYDRPHSPLEGLAYTAFQELATRISHQNTGRYSSDPVADKIMARVAADENLHMVFYRDALSAAFEVAPSPCVRAIAHEVTEFAMPGEGIEGFARKAVEIAEAGIYDLRVHHDEVIRPLLGHWRVFERGDLDPAGEEARERLGRFLEKMDATATRYEERRAARRVAREAR